MPRGIRSEKSGDVTVYGVTVTRESEKALLIQTKGGEEIWLPKSQLKAGGTVSKKGDSGTIVMSRWIAGEKGLKDGDGLEDDEKAGDYEETWAGGYDD